MTERWEPEVIETALEESTARSGVPLRLTDPAALRRLALIATSSVERRDAAS